MFRFLTLCVILAVLGLVSECANAEDLVTYTTPVEDSFGSPAVFGADIFRLIMVQNQVQSQLVGSVGYDLVGVVNIPYPTMGGSFYQYTMYSYSNTQTYVKGSGTFTYNVFRNLGGDPQFPNKTYFRTLGPITP